MKLFKKKTILKKRCPKCLKFPTIIEFGIKNEWYVCLCQNCNISTITGEKTENKAIKSWNKYVSIIEPMIKRVEFRRRYLAND